MGTIFILASATVSLFLLALLIGILGKKNKVTKIACVTLYIGATLFVSAKAFGLLFEYNALLGPLPRLFLSFVGFVASTAVSYLLFLQASILAEATRDKIKEYLKAQLEKISLPTVEIPQRAGRLVRMAYSLFL